MMTELLLLLTLFLKIGAFSFGGGLAVLPMIFQTVSEYNLIDTDAFANLVALSQVTPGPIMVNAATYIGFNFSGILGAIVATIGVSIPSLTLMMIVLKFLDKFNNSKIVTNIMKGIRPATVGLVASGVVFLINSVPISYITGIIFLATVVMSGKFKINPILIVIVMALAGGFLCG